MLRPQNKKYRVFLLPLILAFSFSAHAQTSKLTSDEAVSIAIQNNTGLKAVEHYYQQQRALLPTSFNIEKTQIYYDYDENNIAENGYPLGVIGIEQSFEFPTVYFSQRQEARHGIDAAMKEFEQAQRNLQKNVELAFHKIQFLQKKLEKLQIIDSIYANYTKAAEQKFMAGDINKLDYLNAKSHHDQLKIQVKQTTNDIRIAHKEFNALLQADKEYSVVPEPITRLQLSPTATEETPGYQILEQNIKQLKTAVKTEKNKLLPDISVGYYNGTNRYDNARNYAGVQVGLAFPIFFGNQKAHIDAAKQNQIATVFKQQDYRTRYNLKINTLGLELEKNAEQLQYYEDTGISLSEQIIETAQKSYQNGEIDFFRFVHFIENAINIEIEYMNNLYKFNQTVIEINFLTIN